nr:choice-of-anchor X domain-containing protein [Aliikangiella sp. G2MR2-5]
MFDDGTHGDLVASDGIYTRACMYLPEEYLANAPFVSRLDIWFIKPEYRGTQSLQSIADGVAVNEAGFFIEVGDDYNNRAKNNWLLHSPESCKACETAWSIAGDVFDFFVVSTRDAHNGAGYVRVHDNIEGTGFNPPCEPRSHCYNIIDEQEHQKLTGIIWSGWPGIEGMNHELGHGLLGLDASNFPGEGIRAWNSGDNMHLDSDTTVTGELAGPFWDPDRGWPYPVVFETAPGVFEETYLIRDEQGDFRLEIMNDSRNVWADIFLYMMGLLEAEQVTSTYYKLVNPSLEGCETQEYYLLCTNNLVTAEETIAFTVNDFIGQFGQRVLPENFDPSLLTLGILHISDRAHTDAEIVWFTNIFSEFAGAENLQQEWGFGTNWSKATRGLSRVDIDATSILRP